MTDNTQTVQIVNNGIKTIKKGVATTEFYLSTFVTAVGTLVQFLPTSEAPGLVKAAGLASSVLAVLGYTASRTVAKK